MTNSDAENERMHLLAFKETRGEIEELLDILAERGVRKCSEHGDFHKGNILMSGAKAVVIDWSFYRAEGNPLFDFCSFIVSNTSESDLEAGFYRNLSGCGPYSETILQAVRLFCLGKGLPPRAIALGIPYMLGRCIARYSLSSQTADALAYYRFSRLLRAWNDGVPYSDFPWLAGCE